LKNLEGCNFTPEKKYFNPYYFVSTQRYKCRVAVDGDPHECPQVEKIPCPEPEPCPSCHVTLWDKDDYCCDQVECGTSQ